MSASATRPETRVDRVARQLRRERRTRLRRLVLPALGITMTRLTTSKSLIVNGQTTQEETFEGIDLSPGAIFGDIRLKYAELGLRKFMKSKVTAAESPLLAILSELPGGWTTAFAVLKHIAAADSECEEARLMASWEEIHSVHGEATTPEMIAAGAGMTPSHMLGLITEACHAMKVNVAKLIAALNMDEVMERAVKEAKKPTGFKDRERLLQSAGLYPTPAGVTINNSPTAIAAARAAASAAAESTNGLGEFERDTVESTSFLRGIENAAAEQRRIESPSNFVTTTVVKESEEAPAEPAS